MNFAEYAPLARRTLKELPFKEHLQHMSLGFCGEMGEMLDATKKHIIYGKPLDTVNIIEEIGDVTWYCVNLCKELAVDPAQLDTWLVEARNEKIDNEWFELDKVQQLIEINRDLALVADGLVLDYKNLSEEHGTGIVRALLISLHTMAETFKIDLYAALDVNIKKLAARYGDKYSDYAALNRNLAVERDVLETSSKGEA